MATQGAVGSCPMSRGDETGLSLRRISDWLTIGLIGFGIVSGLGLVLLVAQLGRTGEELRRYDQSVRATQRVRLQLLVANRLFFLDRVEPGAGHDLRAARAMRSLEEALTALRENVQSAEEEAIVEALAEEVRGVDASFADRSLPPLEQYRRISAELDRTLGIASSLLDINRRQAAAAVEHAARWRSAALWGGVALGVAQILVAFLLAFAARRAILRPIRHLEEAIARYGAGDLEARAERAGPQEVRSIATQFDAMADRLAAQAQQRLTFVATVAHDLRNPIATVRTAVQLIERELETRPEQAGKRIGLVIRQLDRLGRMVDDLLDVSRTEAGELSLELARLDLRDAVRAAALLFASASDRHAIALDLPSTPVEVEYDPVRIDQVLVNLLSNAIKYAPQGGRIDVRLETRDGRACVSVRDPGVGIAPEDIERIFEPFHRGKADRTDIPGIGLGLAATRRLVVAHRGTIEVESEPGAGSTFRVCLPLARAE